MLISFSCPECKAVLEADALSAGAQIICPQCSQKLTVPRQGPGPGVTIGQFEIQKLLGKGGMGEVYLARQLSLGRDIALKILPARMSAQKNLVDRFLKEVHLLAKLDHPNIVTAYEAGEDAGILYLAMGYVGGDSLEQKIRLSGPLSEREALKLVDKLAGALDYAWSEHRILHRDIKPGNILMTTSGEAKLTDMGLAKSLDEGGDLTMSGDIMGSPNYMSPEQINGLADLDCRTDMYALGATLYFLLTARLPFAGTTIVETLQKQVNDALKDPREYQPGLTEGCVALLEIMLAKDRAHRHADWKALKADLARVMAGKMPKMEALQPGESVLLRARIDGMLPTPKVKGGQGTRTPASAPVRVTGLPLKWAIGGAAGLAVVIGLVALLARGSGRKEPSAAAQAPVVAAVTSAAQSAPAALPVDDTWGRLNEQYLGALKYAREHPDDFAGALVLLEPLVKAAAGTAMEGKIADEIGRVGRVKQQAVEKALTDLKAEVQAQVAQSNYDGALKRIELDTGLVTEETKIARAELLKEVKAQQKTAAEGQAKQAAEAEQARQAALAREKLDVLAQGLADDLLKGNQAELSRRLTAARADPALGMLSNAVNELSDQALQAIAWPERVAKSFEADKGKEVAIEFKNGKMEQLVIIGVEGERIKAQRKLAAGYIGRDFVVNDLSVPEKLKRLGDDPRAGGKLRRGLVQVRCANNWEGAAQEFTAAGGMLGEALVKSAPVRQAPAMAPATEANKPQDKPAEEPAAAEAKAEVAASVETKKPISVKAIARRPMGPKEGPAKQALQAMLKLADVTGELSEPQALAEAIGQKECASNTVAQIKTALADFNKNYSQTQTAQEYTGVLSALESLEAAMAPVALKPATEETITAALAEMEKDNGKLQSQWRFQDDGIWLLFVSNTNLKKIDALAGLPLVYLNITKTSVRDLRPLIGMPLVDLRINSTLVDNLKPLQNMKSLRRLDIGMTKVADLKPLHGLKLENLSLTWSKVHDLAPLAGMPLTYLDASLWEIKDISALKGMPLKSLYLYGLTTSDFSFLKGMPLEELGLSFFVPPIKNIKFIEEFSLRTIYIAGAAVNDLSLLRGMNSLEKINIQSSKVTDLTPLKDKNLRSIDISNTGVTSLEPLASSRNLDSLIIYLCKKLTDTDKIPDYFPDLKEISISPDFPHPEILTRCASLDKIVIVDKKGQGTTLTMDEFKKRYVKAGKQADKK